MRTSNWTEIRLSGVLESVFAGAWGENSSDSANANICVLRATNIDAEGRIDYGRPANRVFSARELASRKLAPGDLILEASGGGPGTPVGRVALHSGGVTGSDYACSNFFRVLRPNLKVVDPAYLTHLLLKVYRSPEIWRYQQQTTGLVNLKLSDYLDQVLLVPPLHEQRRIVEVIDAVSAQERAIEASIAKLRSVRQGALASVFSLSGAEESWPLWPLDRVAHVGGGIALGGVATGGGAAEIPYLRVANVQDGFISTREMKTIRVTPVEAARFLLKRGDVLLTEGGDLDKLGRGGVWDGRIDPCLHQNHVFRVRCVKEAMVPEFLALYLASPEGRAYFLRVAKQTTNLASVSSSQIKAMPVPCPPLSVQQRTVEEFSTQDECLAEESWELAKLRTLKLGLIDDLFAGGAVGMSGGELPVLDGRDER